MGIDFNISIKRKIVVNGKEYGSLEEVPEQHRHTVQNAMDSAAFAGRNSTLTVNGVVYDSPEAMPPDTRRIYEESLRKAKEMSQRTGMPMPGTLSPEGMLSERTVITILLLAGLYLLLKYFQPG